MLVKKVDNEIDDKLKIKFTNLFLDATKELQKVKIWTDQSIDKKTGKTTWENLFENTLKELFVVYGYFVEYEPNDDKVIYFIKNNLANRTNPDFSPPYIPYFESTDEGNIELFETLLKAETKFSSQLKSPKLFQHLPLQPKEKGNFDDFKLISDQCMNCHVPCQIRSNNDYFVVLFDEVVFFQYAYCYLKNEDVYDYYRGQEEIFLIYILKFAIGIELKLKRNKLWGQLGLLGDNAKDWNCPTEIFIRKKIFDQVKDNFKKGDDWVKQIDGTLRELVDCFIEKSKKINVYREAGLAALDILKHIARFDVEASFKVRDKQGKPILHDVFVFPIYTQKKDKVFTTNCIQGQELDVHSPILLVLYIKTLSVISNFEAYDETEGSSDGFQLTKEIAKLFAEKIIQEDYLKNVVSKQTRPHATRAAISQVMARNMSHNIGSHVMSNLTDGIELSKKVNEKVACKAYTSYALENNEDNIIYQLATYNNYVKSRMDYLSDITFGTPVMQTNKKVIGELFQDLDKVRLLLDNISGLSKNFPYKINFIIESGNKDLTVAIPNDLLGCQAFYNIIENVIRNTAKHNQGKKNVDGTTATTSFFVNFKDIFEKEEVEEKNVWYEVEIYDDVHVPDIAKLVKEQNEKINLSVTENNQLRNSSLGLLEMEASAAYLRKLDIINIESPDYKVLLDNSIHTEKKLNILKAFSKEVDGENCLGYRFFVSKPTEYLFVDDDLEVSEARETELTKMGIWLKSKSDFTNEIPKIIFNHQFLFHKADSEIKNLIEKHQTHLPIRVIELNEKTNSLLTLIKAEKKDFTEIEKCVWEIWFNEIKGNYKVVNAFASYQSDTDEQEGRYNIAFSDHLETWNISKKLLDSPNKEINFLDALTSIAQKKLPGFTGKQITDYFPKIEMNYTVKNKLFESAIRTVLVMDERIQRFSELTYDASGESVPNIEIFNSTNVNIPASNDFKLDADNYNQPLIGKIIDYINTRVEKNNFLLIHYSILERMFSTKNATIQDPRINEHLRRWAKNTRVVVTSGRGKPKELPEEVCYVNLSPVLNVFTQTRSKYAINYLLNQARK